MLQCNDREQTGGWALLKGKDFKEVSMAIIYDHEPGVRASWQRFERNRRIASHSDGAERNAVILVALVTFVFWLIVGFGLYMAF